MLTNPTALTRPSTDSTGASRGRIRTARQTATEAGIAVALWITYRAARTLTSDSVDTALANAEDVISVERRLGAFTEQTIQRLALDVPGLIHLLNHFYVAAHFPVTVALLVWCFARHRAAYPTLRNWITATTFVALVVHIAYPLAPPRMVDGFVDTLRVHGPNIYPDDPARSVANQFAAMPSLHFGWSVIVAATVIVLLRRRARWIAVIHPSVTLLAIVATGNHYWLDAAVAGAIVAITGLALEVHRRRRVEHRLLDVVGTPLDEESSDERHHPPRHRHVRRRPSDVRAPRDVRPIPFR